MKVISSAPSRISLFGGGTDIEEFSNKHTGLVVSIAINIYSRVTLYTGEDIWEITGNRIPWNADPNLFYKIRDNFKLRGMHLSRVRSSFDGFIGAGLGSSASSAVALVGAIVRAQGLEYRKELIANEAFKAEVKDLGWFGGQQDQYASSFGGGNIFEFRRKNVTVQPLARETVDELSNWLVLFFIGGVRNSHEIQKEIEGLTEEQEQKLLTLKEMTGNGIGLLHSGDFGAVGRLMDACWVFKKGINPKATNKRIDAIYEYAILQGALGGKILGAGGSGYMAFIVAPNDQDRFTEKMVGRGLSRIDYMPDFNGVQSRII